VRPVAGQPLLRLDPPRGGRPWLVLADLHLGLGAGPDRPTGPPEASAEGMAGTLLGAAHREAARGFVVAGDVKHPIVGTPRYLRPVVFDFFSELLAVGLKVEVVLGNHDVGLVPHLPREVVVHPSGGAVRGGVGIAHGHRWPDPRVLRAWCLVVGHLHPGVRLAPTPDSPEGKYRCWVRARLPPPRAPRRGRKPPPRPKEVVVLPAFNPIAGAESLNRERPRRARSFLYRHLLAEGEARAYLLDGTDLGPIVMPAGGPPPNGAPPGARRGR
jgi:uncharacterized protein